MVFDWQDSHVPQFLELYRGSDCLWNPHSRYYSNKVRRGQACRRIAEEFNLPGLTEEDVRKKIRTIRTRYVSEVAKIRRSERSGAGVADVYKPRLFWFSEADAFLRPVLEAKQSTSNLEVSGQYISPILSFIL